MRRRLKMPAMNATTSMVAMIPAENMGWLVTVTVFITILITLFLLFRYFRQFIYGAVTTAVLAVIYWVSRSIGKATTVGDYSLLKIFAGVIIFIAVSLILGFFIRKIKYVKELEEIMEPEEVSEDINPDDFPVYER
jgi:hypothetical protein